VPVYPSVFNAAIHQSKDGYLRLAGQRYERLGLLTKVVLCAAAMYDAVPVIQGDALCLDVVPPAAQLEDTRTLLVHTKPAQVIGGRQAGGGGRLFPPSQ